MRDGFSSASMYIICIRLSENKSSLWIIIQASQFSTSTYEFAFQQYVKLNYMKSILDSILKLWGRKSFLELQIFYHFWLFYACRVTDKRQELTARGNPLSSGNKQKKKKSERVSTMLIIILYNLFIYTFQWMLFCMAMCAVVCTLHYILWNRF